MFALLLGKKKRKKNNSRETQKHPIWLITVDVRVEINQMRKQQLVLLLSGSVD